MKDRQRASSDSVTAQSEVGALRRVWVRDVRDAFRDVERVGEQWSALNYSDPPDIGAAESEFDGFVRALEESGATVESLPPEDHLTLDALYVRDASIVTDRGLVLCRMGKTARQGEPEAQGRAAEALDVPVLGAIEGEGRLEGGDFVWLGDGIAAVGLGYRTNMEGIRQLRTLLCGLASELIVVPLPHWRGPGDVFHLMSMLSPVDDDLAVVYSPLLPVPFRQRLRDLGIELVEVPDAEFDSMGANVLATGPRRALMVEGNPVTRDRMERAGVEVVPYVGDEISRKGCGGPTCLTRPLERAVTSR